MSMPPMHTRPAAMRILSRQPRSAAPTVLFPGGSTSQGLGQVPPETDVRLQVFALP
jgi:hypothetical protein